MVVLFARNLIRKYSQNAVIKKKICIVGSGPGGFYAAQYILKHLPDSCVDLIEKLPVPYGLVRYEKYRNGLFESKFINEYS